MVAVKPATKPTQPTETAEAELAAPPPTPVEPPPAPLEEETPPATGEESLAPPMEEESPTPPPTEEETAPPPPTIEESTPPPQPEVAAVPEPPPPPEPAPSETTGETQPLSETAPAAPQTTAQAESPPEPQAESTQETPAAKQTQTASLPPAEGQLRIQFPEGSAELPEIARQELTALAQKLGANESMRIQLLAYASGTTDAASRARRMSLSRALAVRSYLIAQGVRSTRMDVRALGNNVQGEPADRVDIIPQAQ